jgi:hypothetical protein
MCSLIVSARFKPVIGAAEDNGRKGLNPLTPTPGVGAALNSSSNPVALLRA